MCDTMLSTSCLQPFLPSVYVSGAITRGLAERLLEYAHPMYFGHWSQNTVLSSLYSCHPDDVRKLVLHAPQIVEREMYKVHSYV